MMYPILYSKNAEPVTDGDYHGLGLGVLDEARDISVVEELNGAFTLTLLYPVTGRLYNSIEQGCLLLCKSNPYSNPQLFRIQQINRPMNGVIEIYAPHKSYDLSGYVMTPCSYSNISSLFADLNNKLLGQTPIPWSWWTDISSSDEFSLKAPVSARSALAGDGTSILGTYGGEFEFDNNTIKLHNHRGSNNGVTIRYGHNLIDFNQEEQFGLCYTDVYPYWSKDIYDEAASTTDNPVYRTVTVTADDLVPTRGTFGVVSTSEGSELAEASWESVCYGDGKFVAIADSCDFAGVSTDGVHWTASFLPANAWWGSVCYGEGKFVALTYYDRKAAYSKDGVTWTLTRLPSSLKDSHEPPWYDVCYGNGKFVAVARNRDVAAHSPDGITWYLSSMPSESAWASVCYGNGKFVAIARGNNAKVAYSTNGVTWTEKDIPAGTWNSVCYGNGRFITVGYNSNTLLQSFDGINWTSHSTLPRSSTWDATCFGNGKFLVFDDDHVAYSSTGLSWIEVELPSDEGWTSACYGDDRFVAVSSEGNIIYTTPSERKNVLALNLSDYEFESATTTDTSDDSSSSSGSSSSGSETSDNGITLDYIVTTDSIQCRVSGMDSNHAYRRQIVFTLYPEGTIRTVYTEAQATTSNYVTFSNLSPGNNYEITYSIKSENGSTEYKKGYKKIETNDTVDGVSFEYSFVSKVIQCRITGMDSSHAYRRKIMFNFWPAGYSMTVFTEPYATTSDYVTFQDLDPEGEYQIDYSIMNEDGSVTYLRGSQKIKSNVESETYIPTSSDLVDATQKYIALNNIGIPEVTMTVNFIDLSKTTEYKNLAYQTIKLGDTVNVMFEKYGINTTAEVVKTTYDPLNDSYTEIELGNRAGDIASTIQNIAATNVDEVKESVSDTKNSFEKAVEHATQLLTTSYGGQVLMHVTDDSGKPSELLILARSDNVAPTLENATEVWRWNKNGLAHSSTGYEGPYGDVAITKDGHIVADTIVFREGCVTGQLDAGHINTSGLTAEKITVKDSDNNTIFDADVANKTVQISAAYITGTLVANEIMGSDVYLTDDNGDISATFSLTGASSWSGRKLVIDSGAIEIGSLNGSVYISSSKGHYIQISDKVSLHGNVIPAITKTYDLGSSTYRWNTLYSYSSSITTSDRNEKNSIVDLPKKYVDMLDGLSPSIFKMNSGSSGRFHVGFIAQDVKEQMDLHGIASDEFAGWCMTELEDGTQLQSLRYEEFIPILLAKVQSMDARIKMLEDEHE